MDKKYEFICINCKKEVEPLMVGKRNHCPYCLCSKHIDIFPYDNANTCHGLMLPYATWENQDGELFLVHKCSLCNKTSRAKVALDDNYNEILKIM